MDSPTVLRTAAMLGFSSSLYVSGIFFSSSQLTVPILYRFPAAISTDFFTEFYYRGLATVVPLTVVSAVSFGTAAYLSVNKRIGYAVAGALTLASQPWTILFMMDNIQKLLEIAKDETVREKVSQEVVVSMLKKWKWQNMFRAGFALAGSLTGLFVTAQSL